MARPREFDSDQALEKAMHVFWQNGYEGASLPDLLDGMGLTRGSLYKAFKDKRSLFLLVLARYEQGAVASAVELLNSKDIPDGADRIETLFGMISDAVSKDDRRGCLLCSAAAGPSSYDTDIAAAVQNGLETMRNGFIAALNSTSIATDERPALADILLTQYVGLRIMARSVMSYNVLNRAVASINLLVRRN